MSSIADRVTQVIENAGLSINAAAKKSGLPQSKLFRIAKGVTKRVDLEALQAIAETFNVSVQWIQTGEGSMFRQEQKQPLLPPELAGSVADILARNDVKGAEGFGEKLDVSEGPALLVAIYNRMTAENQRDIIIQAIVRILAQEEKAE